MRRAAILFVFLPSAGGDGFARCAVFLHRAPTGITMPSTRKHTTPVSESPPKKTLPRHPHPHRGSASAGPFFLFKQAAPSYGRGSGALPRRAPARRDSLLRVTPASPGPRGAAAPCPPRGHSGFRTARLFPTPAFAAGGFGGARSRTTQTPPPFRLRHPLRRHRIPYIPRYMKESHIRLSDIPPHLTEYLIFHTEYYVSHKKYTIRNISSLQAILSIP